MVRWVVGSILHGVDPLSYFSFQPVLHDWWNNIFSLGSVYLAKICELCTSFVAASNTTNIPLLSVIHICNVYTQKMLRMWKQEPFHQRCCSSRCVCSMCDNTCSVSGSVARQPVCLQVSGANDNDILNYPLRIINSVHCTMLTVYNLASDHNALYVVFLKINHHSVQIY